MNSATKSVLVPRANRLWYGAFTALTTLTTLMALMASTVFAGIPERPEPPRLCNDFSRSLDQGRLQNLEEQLVAFDKANSVQVCLVVVQDLDGMDVSDYATRLFEKWGIGRAAQDDGVLLLLALDERKIRIETGYGLEATLTDALCRRLIETRIVPALRSGGPVAGLETGAAGLMELIQGTYTDTEAREDGEGGKRPSLFWMVFGLVMLVFFIGLLSGGTGGGTQVGRGGHRSWGGGPMIFPGGGLGGGGGFGGGGGGFGGFGGGFSGGGGASGGW